MLSANQDINDEQLIDMKSIPINQRHNIGIQDMDKYKNGGLTVESLEVNGALVYIPYGIYCDIFRAIEIGNRVIGYAIGDRKDLKLKRYLNHSKVEAEILQEYDDYIIEKLSKCLSILENIQSMVDEV